MATATSAQLYTYFHTDGDGHIWKCTDGMPTRIAEHMSELTQRGWRAESARILGTAENAPLILAAYESRARGELGSVQLGSPLLAGSVKERDHPVRAMLGVQEAPPRLQNAGGWHELHPRELTSYRLAEAVATGRPDHELQAIYGDHPLYARMAFVEHDPAAMARLIGMVRDPRWYVAPARPERISKLCAYLGVEPGVVAAVADGANVRPVHQRYRVLRDAWLPAALRESHPRNFLGRIYTARGGGLYGEMKASRTFVAFLRYTWMDQIMQLGEPLFEPSFIMDVEAAEAYQAFARTHSVNYR